MVGFNGSESVRKEQRLLLDVCGLLLSRMQGRTPGHGVVWHGRECRATKVRLSPDPRKAERLLRDLQQSREAGPPRLVLNDGWPHAPVHHRGGDFVLGFGSAPRTVLEIPPRL